MLALFITLLLDVAIAVVEHYPCAATLLPLFIAVHTLGFGIGFALATRETWRERRACRAELDRVARQLKLLQQLVD